ncbi:hypothetical protein Tco_0061060, partial [Tanacetum coccineum]
KSSKGKPSVHKDQAFEDHDDLVDVDDTLDYMMTEEAQDEGRTSPKGVSTEVSVSTARPDEGTDKQPASTDSVNVSTDRQGEGTAKQDEGKSATPTTSTPTPTTFGDDETIAQVLITMSQNKQKEKGVEIKNVEDTERPRTATTRSVLNLKHLPKIDPKDKGKKMINEEDESDTESDDDITKAEKKFKQLAKDEEARMNADRILAEELQKEEREKFTIEERARFLHDTIAAQRKFLAQ